MTRKISFTEIEHDTAEIANACTTILNVCFAKLSSYKTLFGRAKNVNHQKLSAHNYATCKHFRYRAQSIIQNEETLDHTRTRVSEK